MEAWILLSLFGASATNQEKPGLPVVWISLAHLQDGLTLIDVLSILISVI